MRIGITPEKKVRKNFDTTDADARKEVVHEKDKRCFTVVLGPVNTRSTGSAQYHLRLMLALLIYCYANGIFSSRRIERATCRDIGERYVV